MKIVERIVAIFFATVLTATAASAQVVRQVQRVDHVVYATPDLDRGIAEIEKLVGVRATLGGKHPGGGTKNAFIALGPNSFLGIVAPDPDQPPPVSWQFTDPAKPVADGVVPFIIDWGDTPHPSQSAAKGATLISLRAEHPDPREAKRLLLVLGLKIPVKKAKLPALIATIEGPRGRVELK